MPFLIPFRVLTLLIALAVAPVAVSAQGPDVPAVGVATAFDVATWNIEHFGHPERGPSDVELQFQNVLAIIQQAEVDLWALQELNHEPTFTRLLDELGADWEGFWQRDATVSGFTGYGYLWRTDRVEVLQTATILTEHNYDFAFRPPLLMRANVMHEGGARSGLRIINIHAKCCGRLEDWERRTRASAALKTFVDNFVNANLPVLVLGDLNDELRVSISGGRTSPYANFRTDAGRYHFGSLSLEDANVNTWCANSTCTSGSTIDHVLITRPLFDAYVENSTQRFNELLTSVPNYVNTTSDHVAVLSRFDFAPAVSAEDSAPPATFSLDAPFPNPFHGRTTVSFTLAETATVRVEAFDALGRRVSSLVDGTLAAGAYETTFDAGALPPGLYLVRLTASGASGEHTATRRVVRLP
jgi:endonuclease/exonuclease/phosphatase family metal-dependent hydrolase